MADNPVPQVVVPQSFSDWVTLGLAALSAAFGLSDAFGWYHFTDAQKGATVVAALLAFAILGGVYGYVRGSKAIAAIHALGHANVR